MVEHRSPKPAVGGSSPSWPANIIKQKGVVMAKITEKTLKYLREVKIEMSKVSWPSMSELKGSTILVIILSVFFAIYVGGVDLILAFVRQIF